MSKVGALASAAVSRAWSSASSAPPTTTAAAAADDEKKKAQRLLDKQYVDDRRAWRAQLKVLRKQFAEDWEKLDKSLLRKTKAKRKEEYQPLNRAALLESARVRWQENEERKANLRALEAAWLEGKKERAEKIDRVMDAVEEEREAAEARRLLWLLERSEEWIPEENLDLAITAAILEPTEL